LSNSANRGIRVRLIVLIKFYILHVANDCRYKHGGTRHPTDIGRRPAKRLLTNQAWFSPHLRRSYKYKCCRGETRYTRIYGVLH